MFLHNKKMHVVLGKSENEFGKVARTVPRGSQTINLPGFSAIIIIHVFKTLACIRCTNIKGSIASIPNSWSWQNNNTSNIWLSNGIEKLHTLNWFNVFTSVRKADASQKERICVSLQWFDATDSYSLNLQSVAF